MHLYQNMHKEFKGIALRQLLWKSARAITEWEFNLHMNKMKEVQFLNYFYFQALHFLTLHIFYPQIFIDCSQMP